MSSYDATKRSVVQNFLFQGAATLSTYIASLALMPLVLKIAGAGIYGMSVLWYSLLTLVPMLLSLGTGYRARRELPGMQEPADRARVFISMASIQLLTSGVASLVLIVSLPVLNTYLFQEEQTLHPAVILVFVLSLYLNSLSDTYFRSTHRIRLLAITSVIQAVLYPTFVILHVIGGGILSLNSLLLSQAAAFGVLGGFLWYRIACEIKLRFGLGSARQYVDDIRLGFPLICTAFVEIILFSSDRYILAGYLTPAHVGVYAAASAVGSLVLIFPKVASGVLLPALSSLVDAGHRQEAQTLLDRTLKVFLGLGFPFIAGGAIMAKPILQVLATPSIADEGRFVVPLIATASVLYGCMYIAYNAAFVIQRTGLWLRVNLLAMSLSISLNVVMLYFFRRLEIVSVTAIICYAVSFIAIYYSLTKEWPIQIELVFLARAGAGTTIMSLVLLAGLYGLGSTYAAVTVVALLVPLGIFIYAVALVRLGGLNKGEFHYLSQVFLK